MNSQVNLAKLDKQFTHKFPHLYRLDTHLHAIAIFAQLEREKSRLIGRMTDILACLIDKRSRPSRSVGGGVSSKQWTTINRLTKWKSQSDNLPDFGNTQKCTRWGPHACNADCNRDISAINIYTGSIDETWPTCFAVSAQTRGCVPGVSVFAHTHTHTHTLITDTNDT